MGCRIMVGKADTDDSAVFYCSTTGVAFGPVMTDLDEAEGFVAWLAASTTRATYETRTGRRTADPREYPRPRLMELYAEFRKEYDARTAEVESTAEKQAQWAAEEKQAAESAARAAIDPRD